MEKKKMDIVRAWEKQYKIDNMVGGTRKQKDYARYIRWYKFITREHLYIPGALTSREYIDNKDKSASELRDMIKNKKTKKGEKDTSTWIDHYYDNALA